VLAAGAWSGSLLRDAGMSVPVHPVKGQTIRVTVDEPIITCVVRGSVKGAQVYVVPRAGGELVIGASSEEAGFDLRPRAGAVYELLRDAQSLVPGLSEAHFGEVSTSVRPGTPDNAPIIGQSGAEGLVFATGHYRNGILLTPVTADGVADLLSTSALPDVLIPFAANRFDLKGEFAR
jgi:glycine oxidase